MAEAAKRILRQYKNVTFTFAGEGPDESYLKQAFVGEDRVSFTKFELHEALEVNLRHDICVVPSLAAEGTSLSVAEAMGAGRAVIATNVGGITNMIIDGYNGLLVFPEADSLADALSRLINNETLRLELGQAAYETARRAFSFERWRKTWVHVLTRFAQRQ